MPEVGSMIDSQTSQAKEEGPVEEVSQSPIDVATFLNQEPEKKKLSIVIKADSQGTLEAIQGSLKVNDNIKIVLSAVGGIHRSDIFLAKTTKSIVIGFSVPVNSEVRDLAKQEKVIIKNYQIIYELLDELEEVSSLIHEKEEREKNLKAQAKVLAKFMIEGQEVYGCLITKGKVNIGDPAEIYRKDSLIEKTKLISLKVRAKNVQEVKKDQECGMQFATALDIKVGDMIKFIL